jgi:hypothetical protein
MVKPLAVMPSATRSHGRPAEDNEPVELLALEQPFHGGVATLVLGGREADAPRALRAGQRRTPSCRASQSAV